MLSGGASVVSIMIRTALLGLGGPTALVHGPGNERNFPDETISEPVTVGDEKKQRTSSRYIGVCWDKSTSSWRAQLTDPQTKRSHKIGRYASEEDAARAHDYASVQAHGPGATRNFPGEAISELPVTVGEERKKRRKRS